MMGGYGVERRIVASVMTSTGSGVIGVVGERSASDCAKSGVYGGGGPVTAALLAVRFRAGRRREPVRPSVGVEFGDCRIGLGDLEVAEERAVRCNADARPRRAEVAAVSDPVLV